MHVCILALFIRDRLLFDTIQWNMKLYTNVFKDHLLLKSRAPTTGLHMGARSANLRSAVRQFPFATCSRVAHIIQPFSLRSERGSRTGLLTQQTQRLIILTTPLTGRRSQLNSFRGQDGQVRRREAHTIQVQSRMLRKQVN